MSEQERRIEWMRLDDLVRRRAARNSRVHDLDGLTDAVTALGFTAEPKIDEATGDLVWGHGRLATLLRLRDRGAEAPEGVREAGDDWEIPVIRGWASRNALHADAVREADNLRGEHGRYDEAKRLDVLADVAADAPELLRGIGVTSEELDRLVESVGSLPELPPVDLPAEPEPRDRRERDDEQWGSGDDPDEGSTREPDGPGPLDVEPAWRTLEPLRARYHDGTPDGADRVARWAKSHATDVHVGHDLAVTFRGRDGEDYCPPGKWLTRDGQTGQFDVLTRDEFDARYVPSNEPARRLARDAKPLTAPKATVPSAAELLRNGSGVLLGTVAALPDTTGHDRT